MTLFHMTVPFFFFSFFPCIQIVFAAFTGEAWGYLGSRKFLQELDLGSDSVKGLGSSMIEQVIIGLTLTFFPFSVECIPRWYFTF